MMWAGSIIQPMKSLEKLFQSHLLKFTFEPSFLARFFDIKKKVVDLTQVVGLNDLEFQLGYVEAHKTVKWVVQKKKIPRVC